MLQWHCGQVLYRCRCFLGLLLQFFNCMHSVSGIRATSTVRLIITAVATLLWLQQLAPIGCLGTCGDLV